MLKPVKKILITGFEPFDGNTVNPSGDVALSLDGVEIERAMIKSKILPVAYKPAIQIIIETIEQSNPDIVISLGLNANRSAITPEKVAINHCNFLIPDNAGLQPFDCPVINDAPPAYFSSLPVSRIVKQLTDAELPSAVSYSAGTYVCNALFYGAMHFIASKALHVQAGFIHIPAYRGEEANGAQGLSQHDMTNAIKLACEAVVTKDFYGV